MEIVGPLVFSPNGGRKAYAARDGKQDAWCSTASPDRVHDAVGEVVFSPNSKRAAYTAAKSGKQYVVLDGKPSRLQRHQGRQHHV